jgi:hypothetical protein
MKSWWIRFPWFPDVSISWPFLWCLMCFYMVFMAILYMVRVKSDCWGHSLSKWLARGTEGLGLGQRSAAAMWCCGVRGWDGYGRMGIWRSGSLACFSGLSRSKWFFAYFGLFKLMIFLDICSNWAQEWKVWFWRAQILTCSHFTLVIWYQRASI